MHIKDSLRNVLYPILPMLGVGCIWTFAWANSLEMKLAHDLSPANRCSLIRANGSGHDSRMENSAAMPMITASADPE